MKDLATLRRRAEAGNVAAQAIVGLRYFDGDGTPVDFAEAFRYLSAASARGLSRATVHLAHIFRRGLGVPGDLSEAIRLYRAASEQGEFFAQIELGRIFSGGVELPVDVGEATKWYTAALGQEARVRPCDELEEARRFVTQST